MPRRTSQTASNIKRHNKDSSRPPGRSRSRLPISLGLSLLLLLTAPGCRTADQVLVDRIYQNLSHIALYYTYVEADEYLGRDEYLRAQRQQDLISEMTETLRLVARLKGGR